MDEMSNDLELDQPDFPYKEDLIIFLSIKINLINAKDYNQFIFLMQFDIKEPETYAWAMQEFYAAKWAKVVKES